MPFISQRAKLNLSVEEIEKLDRIVRARTESAARIERAKILLAYHQNETISSIAAQLKTNRPKVERCISKALDCGVDVALNDLPRKGKTPTITLEAKAWAVSIACQKPKDLGYAAELWTTHSLATHLREHCQQAGHPSLAKLGRGTVSKILSKVPIQPHKIDYYLERRDLHFDEKMVQVLHVYKEVELLKKCYANGKTQYVVTLSYDEKPGIQATANIAPDLGPVPGHHARVGRDYEYKRLGTVSLLGAIDLFSGRVHGLVRNRHRSREFIEMLQHLDSFYPKEMKIRIILDNHSAHISKETRKYLATMPNRFEFVFTPTHGSWLNIIETFFSKMTRQLLRGIRVNSKEELIQRLLKYLDEINETPVVFKWKYKLDELSIV
jgi:transposase